MIKALAQLKNGRQMLILGLSRRNTELLLQDKPIQVDPSEHGIDGPIIVLLGGETEAAIVEQISATGVEFGFPVKP